MENVLVLRDEIPLLGAYVAPRTPIEQTLAEIFCKALNMDKVSISDDFEDLGGNSLIAVSIYVDIEKTFDIVLPIGAIAHSPTIVQLTRTIEELVTGRGAD